MGGIKSPMAHVDDKLPRQSSKSAKAYAAANGHLISRSTNSDYSSLGVKDNDIFNLPSSDYSLLGFLTILGAVVRLFRIYNPTSVVFDEVHFGGFATKYIKGTFFMDVHPPLAKMLIALAGWLAGFDGSFPFKEIGDDYLGPGVPYVAMRLYPALCGVMTIPVMFLTLKALGSRTTTAALGACLVIFENGLVTNNRLILLDSPLITATAFTALAWACFTNQHEQGPSKAFGPVWWFWLASTGLCLGATASIKWVGLFTIAWVGSLTVLQLWVLLGDPKHVTPRLFFKHLFARVFCLIIIPIAFYMGMFAIHFLCLVNPGDGDGFMSSEFQATLNGKGMEDRPADVSFGSRVSLRHHNTQGGYLHSHLHMYPEGSKQQQITLYPHKDQNNMWILENQEVPERLEPITGPEAWDDLPTEFITDGSTIKLYHIATDRRLHSHDVRAPVTEADWQQEVSAYGYEGFEGDANDMFRVEIVKSMSEGNLAKERLRTIQTKFRLVHIMTGCVLFSHKVKLPDWGFEQQEVTCAKGGSLPNSVWYIEDNTHPMMNETAEKVNYRRLGFLSKFLELNQVMWTTNAGLTDSHAWDSRPPSWPILRRGIAFWGKDHVEIYLFGNPVIWLGSTVAIALYLAIKGLAILRWQRGCGDYNFIPFRRFDYEVGTMVLGWAFHYFPFFLMSRQLFLHHYFPALYFAIMVLCQVYDFAHYRLIGAISRNPGIGKAVAVAFLAISLAAFYTYAPLAYGNQWTKTSCEQHKYFKHWDWDCNTFFENYTQYDSYSPEPVVVATTTTPPVDLSEKVTNTMNSEEANGPLVDDQGNTILRREERIEYRDENGNLLSPDQVKELEGKVSFQTRYETRTQMIDEQGNIVEEVIEPPKEEGIAPPHPEVEGTRIGKIVKSVSELPPTVDANEDVEREKTAIIEEQESSSPQPGAETIEATEADA